MKIGRMVTIALAVCALAAMGLSAQAQNAPKKKGKKKTAVATPTPTPPSAAELKAAIRTPPVSPAPRINGPSVFGVRPGSPFLYTVPVTGERPMEFSAEGLPAGLALDAATGRITGKLDQAGETAVTLKAKNAKGAAEKKFKIVAGETIALTPPLGWNSWNCWGALVDAGKVLASAKAMVDAGLVEHGWTYINIDDAWQAPRGGEFKAIQGNEKFPDMKGLCDQIHAMGLKVGIYSTPWVTSYAGYIGGSADTPDGAWVKPADKVAGKTGHRLGKVSFAENDAKQWAAWGMDYLKYDWNPNQVPETETMAKALRASGRDIVYSLSNSAPFANIEGLSMLANCWRITGDIRDNWESMSSKGFDQDKWAPFSGPGHWNDPDMLVVGWVGWGTPHPTYLTPDEQYTHMTMWAMVASPLLIGCDMTKLDEFTLNLLTNDEVLAVSQDALGKQATCVAKAGQDGELRVYARPLEDGSTAVGLFNMGKAPAEVEAKWADLKVDGKRKVRDLWRQKDLGESEGSFKMTVAPHGAELVKVK